MFLLAFEGKLYINVRHSWLVWDTDRHSKVTFYVGDLKQFSIQSLTKTIRFTIYENN
jgi:hypothetical protein